MPQRGWTLRALGKQRKTNATRYHLYVGSRKAKLTETESRMVVIRGLGVGEMRRKWYKLPARRSVLRN